jgi:periplasmic protein TonB
MSGSVVAEMPPPAPENDAAPTPTEPRLNLGTLDTMLPRQSRSLSTPLSVALHGAALAAVILVPLLGRTELPEVAPTVHAFFAEPLAVAPQPPPPPPPSSKSVPSSKAVLRPAEPATFTAPVETPESVPEDGGLDLDIEDGVPGGVEGGVDGGVVGGVVGGLPPVAPPPVAPARVGGQVKEPKKLKHVAPEYPLLAQEARVQGVVILEVQVSPHGRVTSASVVRSVPLLDQAALDAVRQWVYTPTLVDGVPVPVIVTVTVNFNLVG